MIIPTGGRRPRETPSRDSRPHLITVSAFFGRTSFSINLAYSFGPHCVLCAQIITSLENCDTAELFLACRAFTEWKARGSFRWIHGNWRTYVFESALSNLHIRHHYSGYCTVLGSSPSFDLNVRQGSDMSMTKIISASASAASCSHDGCAKIPRSLSRLSRLLPLSDSEIGLKLIL